MHRGASSWLLPLSTALRQPRSFVKPVREAESYDLSITAENIIHKFTLDLRLLSTTMTKI